MHFEAIEQRIKCRTPIQSSVKDVKYKGGRRDIEGCLRERERLQINLYLDATYANYAQIFVSGKVA